MSYETLFESIMMNYSKTVTVREEIKVKNVDDYTEEFMDVCRKQLAKLIECKGIDNLDILTLNESDYGYNFELTIVYEINSSAEAYNIDLFIPYLEKFEEVPSFRENVSYKCLGHCIDVDAIFAYEFGKDHIGRVEYDKAEKDVEDIKGWSCYNFEIWLNALDGRTPSEEEYSAAEAMLLEFSHKVDDTDSGFIDRLEDEKKIGYDIPLDVRDMSYLKEALSDVLHKAEDLGFTVKVHGQFTASSYSDFAGMDIGVEDGKLDVHYCRF